MHYVYFIACDNFVKVGYSNRVSRRQNELQSGNPRRLRLVMQIEYQTREAALDGEAQWRSALAACGKPASGEWVELEREPTGDGAPTYVVDNREYSNEELLSGLLSYHHGLRARLREQA